MNDETILEFIGFAILGFALTRLFAPRTSRRPARLPAAPEHRIDAVVATLNRTFGKDWVHMSAGRLKSRLRDALPAPLLALVEVVHMIEDHATDRPLSGATKRWWATRQAARAGLV